MNDTLLIIQTFSTLSMVGLIWFVQIVHYPLFAMVGRKEFPAYEASHQARTTYVVLPLMIAEAATSVWLFANAPKSIATIVGLGLVLLIWASTFLLQVPAHKRLASEYDETAYRSLVRSNWIRTVAWTMRGVLVCWMELQ